MSQTLNCFIHLQLTYLKSRLNRKKLIIQQLQYPLITDAHHPEVYQVYAIIEMNMIARKVEQDATTFAYLSIFCHESLSSA